MATVTFPSNVVWVFNPNYITIEDETQTTADVTVADNTISVSLYNNKAEVYISRLLELVFTAPLTQHGQSIEMSVKVGTDMFYGTVYALWGSIELGERFSQFGTYAIEEGDKTWWVRNVQYFKNFPFSIDVLLFPGTLKKRVDTPTYGDAETIEGTELRNIVVDDDATRFIAYRQDSENTKDGGVFDETFDYTFHTPADTTVVTRLAIRNEKVGFYLRWIDRFGFIEYYLFDKGEETVKTELQDEVKYEETLANGIRYPNSKNMSFETSREVEMCASDLNQETYDYVSSIASAVVVDMYLGKTKSGDEIWLPVRITENSYKASRKDTKRLRDFTITVEYPQRNTQSL